MADRPIDAGRFRHPLTIQRTTQTQNSGGEAIDAWSKYASIRAEIVPLAGRELEVARQTWGQVSHRIDSRFRSGVVPKMRAIRGPINSDGTPGTGARVFQIEAVLNVDERSRLMHLFCTEDV